MISLNEINKLSMLRALESGRFLRMNFHSWNLYEYPSIVAKHDLAFVNR